MEYYQVELSEIMGKRQNASNLGVLGTPAAGGAGGDGKVKATLNDTTPGFLNGKLVAGENIIFTVIAPGGNERLEIAAAGNPAVVVETGVNLTWNVLSPDLVKNNSSNAWTLTLPNIVDLLVDELKFITIFAGTAALGGTITVQAPISTIDGAASLVIAAGQYRTLFPFSNEYNTV